MENQTSPLVALGGSAGGLDAFEKFFLSVPSDTGIVFVVIAHLSPNHISILPELLQRKTEMKVIPIKNRTSIQPNTVYVIPPDMMLNIKKNKLYLKHIDHTNRVNLPIDYFLTELSKNHKTKAGCIIFSGTGTDGTIGLKAIKNCGGITFAQDPESAKYDGMPKSAIATGLVDYILPPEKIIEQLTGYFEKGNVFVTQKVESITENTTDNLTQINNLLLSETGHDFSHYKANTILRRLDRRMAMNQINNLKDYINFLKISNSEIHLLFKDILIGVTNFFRDTEVFQELREKTIPNLLIQKEDGSTIRVWIPACSTGEEAYSIGMLISEVAKDLNKHFEVKIFSTDLDEEAIRFARIGRYHKSQISEISEARLNKFFTKEDGGYYKVTKKLRDMIVFAEQDIIKDPPFAKLDMLSCRNLLIYLDQELQKKIINLYYYSLEPGGILLLGTSETIGSDIDFFTVVNKKLKIYERTPKSLKKSLAVSFNSIGKLIENVNNQAIKMNENNFEFDHLALVETILKQSNNPPCVIIDKVGKIFYINGKTGKYLEPPIGKPEMNILAMARSGLKLKLSRAINNVIVDKEAVIGEKVKIRINGINANVNLSVKPFLIPKYRSDLLLVLFEEIKSKPEEGSNISDENEIMHTENLREELAFTTEKLQTTIEELETSNEELKSANEELQSTNEELQSANEELETSKEELQSMNEESSTVNNELQNRIESLAIANDDMKNLLDSTSVAVIFLDQKLKIRRFTSSATQIMPLKKGDVGRDITDFSSNLINFDIEAKSKKVLDSLAIQEWEVESSSGKYYFIKIRPYRTTNNVIDGIVITLEDITNLKIVEKTSRLAVVLRDSNDAISLIDKDGKILAWNKGAEKLYGYSEVAALKINYKELLLGKTKTEKNKLFNKFIKIDKTKTFKDTRITKRGKRLEVLSTITLLNDEKSKNKLFALTELDIAKIKEIVES